MIVPFALQAAKKLQMVVVGMKHVLAVITARDYVVKPPSSSSRSLLAIPAKFYEISENRRIAGLTPAFPQEFSILLIFVRRHVESIKSA